MARPTIQPLLGAELRTALHTLQLPEGVLANTLKLYQAHTGTTHLPGNWGGKTSCGKPKSSLAELEASPLDEFKLCGSCLKAQQAYSSRSVFGEHADRYQKRIRRLWRWMQRLEKIEQAVANGTAGEKEAASLEKLRTVLEHGGLNDGITTDSPEAPPIRVISDSDLAYEVGEGNVTDTRERFSVILHDMAQRTRSCIPRAQNAAIGKNRDQYIREAAAIYTAQLAITGVLEIPVIDWDEVGKYRDSLVQSWAARSVTAPITTIEEYRAEFRRSRLGEVALRSEAVANLPVRFRCDPAKFSSFRELARAELAAMWDEVLGTMLNTLNDRMGVETGNNTDVTLVVDLRRRHRYAGTVELSASLYEKLVTVAPAVAKNQVAAVYRLPRVVASAISVDLGTPYSAILPECSEELAELVVGLVETSTENYGIETWVETARNIMA